jgi:hypothetical protein
MGHKKNTHFYDIAPNPQHPLEGALAGRAQAERSKGAHKTGKKGKSRNSMR